MIMITIVIKQNLRSMTIKFYNCVTILLQYTE